MKWVYRILAVVLGTLLVSSLTVLTTGFVVNTYVQSLLGSMNIKWEGQPSGLTSLLRTGIHGNGSGSGQNSADSVASDNTSKDALSTGIAGTNAAEDTQSLPSGDPADGSLNTGGSDTSAETGSQDEPASQGDGQGGKSGSQGLNSGDNETVPDNALPVMGGSSGEPDPSSSSDGSDKTVFSPDDLQDQKDGIPSSEKEEVFSMLMNKLPEEEMQKISTAMEGGLTEKELIDVQQILSKYLSKDDYAKMLDIIK